MCTKDGAEKAPQVEDRCGLENQKEGLVQKVDGNQVPEGDARHNRGKLYEHLRNLILNSKKRMNRTPKELGLNYHSEETCYKIHLKGKTDRT